MVFLALNYEDYLFLIRLYLYRVIIVVTVKSGDEYSYRDETNSYGIDKQPLRF